MRRWQGVLLVLFFVLFQSVTINALAFSQDTGEVSSEDQEVIDNLELLTMLDLIEEDQDMLGNYEVIAGNEDIVSSVQEEGDQNE